jgi:phage/plasmid-associated DNA primase
VTINNKGPLTWTGGRFLVYADGAFQPCNDEEFRALLMSWDGMPIGTKKNKKELAMSKSLAGDALSCLRDMLTSASTRFFDTAPDGVAFTNIFVTLVDGKIVLRRHSPANRARHWIDVPYRSKATCRRFDRFLREIMMPAGSPTNVGELFSMIAEAEMKIRAFWEWLGIALLGKATKFGKALLLWGPGGGGKSTLLMIVTALWPAELRSSFALQAVEDKFNRAELAGKRINIVSAARAPSSEVIAA